MDILKSSQRLEVWLLQLLLRSRSTLTKTVDYFKSVPGKPNPLYVFLSHMHSDHLFGLDKKNVGFTLIYCSAATKEVS